MGATRWTKKRALKECAEVWKILAENPILVKSDLPKKYLEYMCLCPCCEYVLSLDLVDKENFGGGDTSRHPHCRRCPMIGLWPDGCLMKDSPYEKWDSHVNKKENARIIYEYALEMLKQYASGATND